LSIETAGKKQNWLFRFRTLSSLQNPVFRTFALGTVCMFAAMTMQMVTGPLLIYRLTDSSALLGVSSLAHALPLILLSLFGGAIADRVQKKNILFVGMACQAAIGLAIALTLLSGYMSRENVGSWWVLIAASVGQGTVMGVMMPSVQAIIPEIIKREQIMNAVALNTMGMNIMSLVAPALAGIMVDAFDFMSVYFCASALFLAGSILMFLLPLTSKVVRRAGSIIADVTQGLRYIRQDKTIFFILAFTLAIVMLSMPYQQLLPIYVDDILKVGATGMGVLLSVSGAGSLVASLVVASLPSKRRGLLLLLSGLISGVALTIFSFSTSWSISLVFIIFVGLGQTLRGTIGNTLVQSYAEPAYIGRVMSIVMMQFGIMSACTFAAGVLAEFIAVQWVVGSFAILLVMISILALVFNARIRKLD